MKTNITGSLFFFFLFTAINFTNAQDTAYDLKDLIDSRMSSVERAFEDRGYMHVKTEKTYDDVYSYWWNERHKKCVIARVYDGRLESVVKTRSSDCEEYRYSRHENYYDPYNDVRKERNYGSHVNVRDLIGMDAIEAYEELMSRGFDKRKKKTYGGTTYGVWYNPQTHQCIKTISKDRRISDIIKSTHCFN